MEMIMIIICLSQDYNHYDRDEQHVINQDDNEDDLDMVYCQNNGNDNEDDGLRKQTN